MMSPTCAIQYIQLQIENLQAYQKIFHNVTQKPCRTVTTLLKFPELHEVVHLTSGTVTLAIVT